MGKKGNIKLILPKNSGNKDWLEAAVKVVFESGGEILSSIFNKKMVSHLSNEKAGADITSSIHKSAMPRYFGLIELKRPYYILTDLGYKYAYSKTQKNKIDVLFDAISSISFGNNNNAVSSESNVEPPLVFLKMLRDLGQATKTEFGCMLYFLEVLNLDYKSSIKRLNSISDLNKEKNNIKNSGGNKFFDPKIDNFFKSIEIIESGSLISNYKLTDYVLNQYGPLIDDFIILSSGQISREIKKLPDEQKKKRVQLESLIKKINTLHNFTEPIIYKLKSRLKKSKKTHKRISFGRNVKKTLFSVQNLFLIGWYGEKYIYELFKGNAKNLLNELKLDQNESIVKIDWYNEGFESDQKWQDKSIGKGCDIMITTTLRNLKIEIKTSWDNISYFTATTNELLSMKNEKKNYFLIKVNKFKNCCSLENNAEVRVIQNPFRIIENVNNIKEVCLYTSI